jgi:hypothetical protein
MENCVRWGGKASPRFQGLLLLLAAASASAAFASAPKADTLYLGGPILTMNAKAPAAQALAVKGGRILAVGRKADVLKTCGPATKMVDLAGRTLLPGFVDAHSHFAQVGLQAICANLLPPPDGPVGSIAELQKVMRAFIATSPMVKEFGVAIGFNYDDSQLQERRSPTAAELDAISGEIPIVVMHQSGHLAVYNSAALAKAGITSATPDPEGGAIRRKAGTTEPDGVLEENAHFLAIFKILPAFSLAQQLDQVAAAQGIYASNGYTTVQEGRADPGTLTLLAAAAKAGTLTLDTVCYPALEMTFEDPSLKGPLMSSVYRNHYRYGGVKLTFDGSPQGKTAWFTRPYFVPPPGQPATYAGYPAFKEEEAQKWVTLAYRNHWQVLVHANGDAAVDQLLRTVRKARAEAPMKDPRTVLIHGQYLRADQVPELKRLGIVPSLYPMHTFYWGDWHRESVAGPERAENISPTGWLQSAGMKFTIHSDAPVTFPNSMRVLDSAVNRTTRSGYVIGPRQRLTPAQALKAMTLWAAYQHFEERAKGSLEKGKLADLVILDRNPLEVDPATLKDIRILETIKEGRTVFTRE